MPPARREPGVTAYSRWSRGRTIRTRWHTTPLPASASGCRTWTCWTWRETKLFAFLVPLGDGAYCAPGAITPLDIAAAEMARLHPAAGASGAAGSRWAEAVYCHIVRHGTLEIPGLNRPRENFDASDWELADDPDAMELLALVTEWNALAGAPADEALVQRTRLGARPETILHGLAAVAELQSAASLMAPGFERVLELQIDTVARRQAASFGSAPLSDIEAALAHSDAEPGLRAAMSEIWNEMRRRVVRGEQEADPELFRLVQKIQALRAKTVAQGCAEEEALSAAEKVAELLDRHGLTISELEFRAQPCHGAAVDTNRRRVAALDFCVPAIAAFFDCRSWVEYLPGKLIRHMFFGLRQDVEAAKCLFDMVEQAFEIETNRFRRGETYREMEGVRRQATGSFQAGLTRGITAKLDALREARDVRRSASSGRDLVVAKASLVEEEVAKLGLKLASRKFSAGRRYLTEAYHAGQAAGSRFKVMPALVGAA